MIIDLASDFHMLMNLEESIMPLIKKYIEIRIAYFKVKEIIIIGVQQSLLDYFLSIAESYYFFKPNISTGYSNKSNNKCNRNSNNNGKKKVASGNKLLKYNSRGLPKLLDFKYS